MGNLNAEKIMQVREDFYNFKSKLRDISKAVKITREFRHGSGVTVTAVATVECYYDLEKDCIRILKEVTYSQKIESTPTEGWLKLTTLTRDGFVYKDVEYFLSLPDWYEQMEDLVCTIV